MTKVYVRHAKRFVKTRKTEYVPIAVHLPPESTISKTAMNISEKRYSK